MVATTTRTAVVRLDHGVFPTNDLGRSFDFFREALDARFARIIGANIRGLNREVPELVFFTLANHHGCGVALQDKPIPAPTRPMEGTIWGFEIDERGIEGVVDTLRRRNVAFEGPIEYPAPSPIAASVFVRDPFDYLYELSVRRDDRRSAAPGQGDIGLRRISHVRLEVTDLEIARRWYTETLGLVPATQPVPGDNQITLEVDDSGQLFILRLVEHMSPRTIQFFRGPHVDVKCPVGQYDDIAQRIANPERYQGPYADRTPWQEPTQPTVYFYDPFFNRLQLSENKPHH
jgi:catechol 2,3-dioxygenase-like lactoylglutathione lyase family enzyme